MDSESEGEHGFCSPHFQNGVCHDHKLTGEIILGSTE